MGNAVRCGVRCCPVTGGGSALGAPGTPHAHSLVATGLEGGTMFVDRILVVEDSPSVRGRLVGWLADEGLDPVAAGTVREAMVAFSVRQPDLGILDLGLPNGDGGEVCRWIRASEEKARIPAGYVGTAWWWEGKGFRNRMVTVSPLEYLEEVLEPFQRGEGRYFGNQELPGELLEVLGSCRRVSHFAARLDARLRCRKHLVAASLGRLGPKRVEAKGAEGWRSIIMVRGAAASSRWFATISPMGRPGGISPVLERLFGLRELGVSVGTELRAGVTTFLTMAYILVVNPQVLSRAGMPAQDVAVATAIASAVATLVMGLWANYPFALAPGMGLNAYFTYGVVQGMGVPWQVALGAVFLEGLLFIALAGTGARKALMEAIPRPVNVATTIGIGLFLAMIGLQAAGVVVKQPTTLVTLGNLHSGSVMVALCGLILTAVLMTRKIRGAILLGIAGTTAAAWVSGLAEPPHTWLATPSFPEHTFLAFDLHSLLTGKILLVVLAFLFVDVFDTAGTLLGVGRAGGFLDEKGNLPRASRAFMADAVGTTFGAMVGSSTVTSYIESAAGVEEGGRTGLTAVVVALLFLLSLPLGPLLAAVPGVATAPALIIVGALMMGGVRNQDWSDPADAIPGFLTLVLMPLTYSIATGISFGLISWVVIRLLTGRWREVPALMWVLTPLLVLFFALR